MAAAALEVATSTRPVVVDRAVKGTSGRAGEGGAAVAEAADREHRASALEQSGMTTLNEGQRVSFESQLDPKKGKPNAVNVKPV